MSVFNDEIDLEVLEFALKHYAIRIPKSELQTLRTYIQEWKQEQPNATQILCHFVFESEAIDLAYDHALMDLRRQYQTQERAKSDIPRPFLTINLPEVPRFPIFGASVSLPPQNLGLGASGKLIRGNHLTAQSPSTLGSGTIADELLQQIDRLLNPASSRTNQSTASVWENADRIAIMASGGAFLGGAIVQLFGGGVTQFIGVFIGAIVGAYSGWKVGPSEPSRKS